MKKGGFVYILASGKNGTLYIGVTHDLIQRVYQHQQGREPGFSKKYGVTKLVYYEEHETIQSAITREKQMKKWRREWKLNLIEEKNPDWKDLYVFLSE